jgi:hypothetical protein
MKDSLWKLAFVVVLATGLAYAQGSYGSSQSQPQSTPPTSDQTSPSQQQPSSSTSGASGQTSSSTSSGMAAGDEQSRIQQALQQDSSLAGVSANVKGDKIELSGTVASKADKDKAKSIAESNAGGKKVVDHIKVSSSSSTSPSPSSKTPPPK